MVIWLIVGVSRFWSQLQGESALLPWASLCTSLDLGFPISNVKGLEQWQSLGFCNVPAMLVFCDSDLSCSWLK